MSLLKPVERPREYAYLVLDQVEGAAALRYRLPEDPGKDSHLRNIELAWDNALSGQVGRARLADGGPVAPADYQLGEVGPRADPDLLSIGEGGLYLRLHHTAGDGQDAWFFDGRTSTRIAPVKWPIAANVRGSHRNGAHGRGARALDALRPRHRRGARAASRRGLGVRRRKPSPCPIRARSAKPKSAMSRTWATPSGLYVQAQSGEGPRASAAYYAFRANGTVMGARLPVPTQASLGRSSRSL